MKSPKNNKVLKPNPGRIILIFTGIYLVFELIFVLSFLSSLDEKFFILSAVLLAATIVFCVITIQSTFYEISNTKIVHRKMGKVTDYYFNDIIFIDEKFSLKHKMLLFYDKEGKDRYLIFDKNQKIFEIMTEKVHQISEEELLRRFPNVKL